MAARRPYVRPMAGWWRRNPFFLRYMAREATSLFVAAYALVLLAGLVALALGPGAYGAWRDALRSPLSIAFHGVLLLVFAWHTWSWFSIMPKTLPALYVAGHRIPGAAITLGGLAAAAVASVLLLLAAGLFSS
jgi:fumarate reductase subunit C